MEWFYLPGYLMKKTTSQKEYFAFMVTQHGVKQKVTFSASSDKEAQEIANDGIDPLKGQWVATFPVPEKDDTPAPHITDNM